MLHPLEGQEEARVVPLADVHDCLEEFAAILQRIEQAITAQIQQMELRIETMTQQHSQTMTESITHFTEAQSPQLATFSERLALMETGFQDALAETLAERLAPLIATLQNYDAVLALLPTLTEQVDKTHRLVTEEITKVVKVTLAEHSQRTRTTHAVERLPVSATKRQAIPRGYGHVVSAHQEDEQASAHPVRHPTPSASGESGDSERKLFVAACLEGDSSLTIKSIQEQAMSAGLHISVGAVLPEGTHGKQDGQITTMPAVLNMAREIGVDAATAIQQTRPA